MQVTDTEQQSEAIAFLSSPAAFASANPVTHIETHGAHVFLCDDTALKIKRAVRYDYMDLSTLALREGMLRRELDLNRPAAPMIYRDILPITRNTAGQLALGGNGPVVEWVLRMHRFPASDELTEVAARGDLTDLLAQALGQSIRAYHDAAPIRDLPGDGLIGAIIEELSRVFADFRIDLGRDRIDTFIGHARATLDHLAPLLRGRAAQGHVRRAHGDLHLRNIVLIDGRPILFDALEFDETLGTCDVLYDLAFLIMDLCHRGLVRQANIVMNAYLLAADGAEDAGLAALPLFMAVRAAIRAMVIEQTDLVTHHAGQSTDAASRYLAEATNWLQPRQPVLIAIGGVSGTGKTVLARDLAPLTGMAPGAVHLRTDTERKTSKTPITYTPQARSAIYRHMLDRAQIILGTGQSVILDATFLNPLQRAVAEQLARDLGLPFCGLWLAALEPNLIDRVAARKGDASDADAAVVHAQLSARPSAPGWIQIDASGSSDTTRAAASAALAGMVHGTTGQTTF